MRRLALLILVMLASLTPAGLRAQDIPQSRADITLSFAPLVKRVAPSVVNIYTKRTVTRRYGHPFLDDPFFQQFFGENFSDGQGGLSREQVEGALGSGVIVSADGLVATNAHVIKEADQINVVLGDGREYAAKVSLMDEPSDIALLRMETHGQAMPFATLKSSDTLQVGDLVLAIGNPFGVGQTVTSGIVSALSRSSLNINDYNFFIQTDAAVNPGNSGGPLVAMDGGIVGINTAIYSRSGGSLGIGFAIPSEMVMSLMTAEGQGNATIRRPWLGVSSQQVTSEVAESLGLDRPYGALISALHDSSPLKKAGARIGDVIVSMNGKPIRDSAEMKFRMATIPLDNTVEVGLFRDGKERVIKVRAAAPPDDPPRLETVLDSGPFDGASIANINPAVISEVERLQPEDSGVAVIKTDPQRSAVRFFQSGDILARINGVDIKTVADVKKALAGNKSGWNIIFRRGGATQQMVIR